MKSSRKQSVNNTMYRYAYAEYLENLCVDSGLLSEINRNQQFIDIMKKSLRKKPYETMALRELVLETSSGLLAASIVTEDTIIQSVGQELGPTYDFSQEIDTNTGKTFSHEWEAGIGE